MPPKQDTALQIGPVTPSTPGPLYQQIVDVVRRAVSEGRLAPGAPLPSFRALAKDLLVSLITVKRAYEELEREGIIVRHQGLGTFVSEGGATASRDRKLQAARDHFANGTREALEAGLSLDEIGELAEKAIQKTSEES